MGGGEGPRISGRERPVLSSAIVVATIAILFAANTLAAGAALLMGRDSTEAASSCSTSRQPTICGWENITAQGPGGYYVCTGSNGNEYSSGPVYTDVSLVAQASGGSPPYTFTWNFLGEASNATGARITENFSQPYPPLVNVSVQDSQGEKNWLFIQLPEPGTPRSFKYRDPRVAILPAQCTTSCLWSTDASPHLWYWIEGWLKTSHVPEFWSVRLDRKTPRGGQFGDCSRRASLSLRPKSPRCSAMGGSNTQALCSLELRSIEGSKWHRLLSG